MSEYIGLNKDDGHSGQDSYRQQRVAVITGTSSGFGMLTAIALAGKQYRVIAAMRNPEKAGELRERAERAGVSRQIDVVQLDVTDADAIEAVIAATISTYKQIDILVNNAGLAIGGFVEDIALDSWRQQMETNFFGLVAMTKSVIPHMRQRQSGLIINISSVSGRVGFPGYAPYASSKFAVEGFSESLRHELAPLGISVVLVEPGAYRTPIWDKGLAQMSSPPDSPYRKRLDAITKYSRQAGETAPDPQQIADFIAALAAGNRPPRMRYLLGRGSLLAVWGKALLPWKWFERIVERATR